MQWDDLSVISNPTSHQVARIENHSANRNTGLSTTKSGTYSKIYYKGRKFIFDKFEAADLR